MNFNSHAHVERDYSILYGASPVFDFNSHAHVERDHSHTFSLCSCAFISTHTLTWSVTSCSCVYLGQVYDFNSHAHVERDQDFHVYCLHQNHFNSHAHVERDFKFVNVALRKEHFNSHAHVERDLVAIRLGVWHFISTHTLTWSVTQVSHYIPLW